MSGLRAILVVPLVAGLLLTTATPVFASCAPRRTGSGVGFAGTSGTLTGVVGVHASIEEYVPYIGSSGNSLMWVMLNKGGTDWSQVGWWQYPGGVRQVFEQHTDGSGHWFTNTWPAQGGSSNDYKVLASASGPGQLTWKFYVAGVLRSTATRLWSPDGYQLFGETNNKSNQMSGGFTSLTTKATFAGPQKQNASGTWSAVTTTAGANFTIYGAQLTSGTYYIWDWACPS